MIAIGGAIGTGLFFASGGAIAQAGPGGAMLAYATMGLAVYCMMQSLGEMATQLPPPHSRLVRGVSGALLSIRHWVLRSAGTTGSAGRSTLAAELVAGALIVQFWFPHSELHALGHGLLCGCCWR